MLKILWYASDLIILIGLYYGTILLVKIAMPFIKLKVVGIILGTIVVNLVAPIIAKYFGTPMYEMISKVSWLSYYQPVTITSVSITAIALLFKSKVSDGGKKGFISKLSSKKDKK